MKMKMNISDNMIDALIKGVLDQSGKRELIGEIIADHGRQKAKALLPKVLNASVKISRSEFSDCAENSALFRINGLSVLVEPTS